MRKTQCLQAAMNFELVQALLALGGTDLLWKTQNLEARFLLMPVVAEVMPCPQAVLVPEKVQHFALERAVCPVEGVQ